MASSDRFHHAIMDFPLPIIAAVNGPALAAGFDIAVLTDLRIASETARFAHPEHAWGEVIYRPLWDLVGGSLARDLVLTGRSIDAREALAAGLVNQVVPQPETIPTASQVATTIAQAPRHVLEHMKAKFLAARGISPDTGTLDL
jgi:enoyl-CoA hydratase